MAQSFNPSNPANSGSYSQEQVDALIAAAKPKFDLLWTNPAPTSAFEAQTIELDLSGYDFVGMDFLPNIDGTSQSHLFVFAIGVYATAELPSEAHHTDRIAWRRRTVTTSATGVNFSIGCWVANSGSTTTNGDTIAVPLHLYGIKF